MKNRRYMLLVIGYMVYVLYRLYWFRQTDSLSVLEYLTYIFGTIDFSSGSRFIWNVALWLIPQFWVILLCSEYFERHLMSNYAVLFTRTNRREKLIFRFAVRLCGMVMVIVLIEIIIACLIGAMAGVSFNGLDWKLLFEIGNIISCMLLIVLMINILTLYVESTYALFISIFTEWVQLILLKVGYTFRFMPVYGLLQELRIDDGINNSLMVMILSMVLNVGMICLGAYTFRKKKDMI